MLTDRNQYLTGWRHTWFQLRSLFRAWSFARQTYPAIGAAFRAMWGFLKNNWRNNRYRRLHKAVVVGDRTFSMIGLPGRPSAAMRTVLKNELNRIVPIPGFTQGLLLLIIAITKKCSLQCAHCLEWEALNQKEILSVDDLLVIIRKFQERGLGTVEISGGEPLNRFHDLLEVLQKSDTGRTDFWVISSGYQLSAARAQQLKAAGLTGMTISLDHWDAAEHDRFRGLPGAFDWAVQAARNARDAGLVVGLNLVATRDFCTPEHLWHYMHLAKSLQVHFVRILEPRAVGHFALSGAPVELEERHWSVLSDFHRDIQTRRAYRDYPIVEYHGSYQRVAGCGGAGNRYLYIDTDGDFHACPFCRHKCGNAVTGSIEDGLLALKQASGCHAFHSVA